MHADNMKNSRILFLLIRLLPVFHLCACVLIALVTLRSEVAFLDSPWRYLLYGDVPISFVLFGLVWHYGLPLLWFGTVGTIWWYLLSRFFDLELKKIIGWMERRSRRPENAMHGN
jgi:hypothetical protein